MPISQITEDDKTLCKGNDKLRSKHQRNTVSSYSREVDHAIAKHVDNNVTYGLFPPFTADDVFIITFTKENAELFA